MDNKVQKSYSQIVRLSLVRQQNEGSFGFAKRKLLCRAKTNVPECGVGFFCLYAAKIPLSFCRGYLSFYNER